MSTKEYTLQISKEKYPRLFELYKKVIEYLENPETEKVEKSNLNNWRIWFSFPFSKPLQEIVVNEYCFGTNSISNRSGTPSQWIDQESGKDSATERAGKRWPPVPLAAIKSLGIEIISIDTYS